MATRDIFSKHLPNVKLATRFDADGKEIQVERREDEEQNKKQQEIFDILVASGYFRARIKGLSAFDKIVGGMTWCIEACDFDVDVDLLFHENLTIGQKIALTEKIVVVLPKMKCPYRLEPHQIQGLDFINIFPVIQWLVKRSVENREEKADKLKSFAVSQFHNHFSLKSEEEKREKNMKAVEQIKQIQMKYGPKRQYKRKDVGQEDEKMRVRITLLEYGDKGLISLSGKSQSSLKGPKDNDEIIVDDDVTLDQKEIDVDQLLKTLYVANEDESGFKNLSAAEKNAIQKNLIELRDELSVDSKELSVQSKIKSLQSTKGALERKVNRIAEENKTLTDKLAIQQEELNTIVKEKVKLISEIELFTKQELTESQGSLKKIEALVAKNEEMKQREIKFKEECRTELARLQNEITEAEEFSPNADLCETQELLEKEKARLQELRLQLAKKNRSVLSIQRQIDNIPDRAELSQYQTRFIELYNQVNAKHRETKQFYTLYNTLEDKKLYMSKELSLLNSIYDNFIESKTNQHSKEHFLKQFEAIVDGVRQTKEKVSGKYNDEKAKRDGLASQLSCLLEKQREYVAAVKRFKEQCERNEELAHQLERLQTTQ